MNPAKYSYYWAESRVSELIEKYPRASEFLLKSLRITKRALAKALAEGDEIFPQLRGMVHKTEEFMERSKNHYTEDGLLVELYKFYGDNRYPRLMVALDRALKFSSIKEQGSRGAGPRSDSDEGQLPLDFS